jgi:hypothetical protein
MNWQRNGQVEAAFYIALGPKTSLIAW